MLVGRKCPSEHYTWFLFGHKCPGIITPPPKWVHVRKSYVRRTSARYTLVQELSDNFPGNFALAPVSEPLSASGRAGTASAPANAQAAQWQSPQLVTEFETMAPATNKDKLEYMTLRAPADMGTSTCSSELWRNSGHHQGGRFHDP